MDSAGFKPPEEFVPLEVKQTRFLSALFDKFTFGDYFLNQKDIAKTPENTKERFSKNCLAARY